MKIFMAAALLSMSLMVHAKTFVPESGMKFSCYDDVANQTYFLKIVDIGDQQAQVMVQERGRVVSRYNNVAFNEYDKGSFFVVYERGAELFSIDFPKNDLREAYYMDGGDSRSLACKFLR